MQHGDARGAGRRGDTKPAAPVMDLRLAGIEHADGLLVLWGRCGVAGATVRRLTFRTDGGADLGAHHGLRTTAEAQRAEPGSDARDGFVLSAKRPRDATELRPVVWLDGDVRIHGDAIRLPEPGGDVGGSRWAMRWRATLSAALARLRHGDLKGFRDDALRRLGLGRHRLRGAAIDGLRGALDALGEPITLIVHHNLGGGSDTYLRQVVEACRARREAVLLLSYHPASRAYLWELGSDRGRVRFRSTDATALTMLFDHALVRSVLFNGCVSFPNPLDLVGTIARLARRYRIPVILPLHDYACICPSFPLLDWTGRYCGVPEPEVCVRCLPEHRLPFMRHVARAPIDAWRMVWGELLAQSSIRAFSASSVGLLNRAYPWLDAARIALEPHRTARLDPIPARSPRRGPQLHVGVVGNISFLKGAEVVAELVRLIEARGLSLRVTVVGRLEHPIRSPRLRVTGAYRRDTLPRLIADLGIDVCLMPSIAPETFSFVTAELMQLQMPIVAFDLGAQAERLRGYPHAVLVREPSAQSALAAIITLARRAGYNPAA